MEHKNKITPHAYDAVYKKFFNNPLMVESLLHDFISEDLSLHFDFSTLERCSESYVSDKFQRRSNDTVWRVRLRNADGTDTQDERWCYLYLLIEFQSSSDYWMAVRVLAYTALLWQSLIERGELKTGSSLPPVLPIVIYNGGSTWKAKTNISGLVANTHDLLQKYQPSQEYFLLDENIFKEERIQRKRGLTALLLKLDRAKTPEAVHEVAQVLITELRRPEYASIRKTFMALLSVVTKDYLDEDVDTSQQNLTEAYSMLAENIRNMVTDSHVKGMELGRLEGREEGRVSGLHMAILRLAKTRWANAPQELIDAIYSIMDVKPLEDVFDALLHITNCEEFERTVSEISAKHLQ